MTVEFTPQFKEIRIKSMDEILEVVWKYPELEFFRGQSNSNWFLEPRLPRLFKNQNIKETWAGIEASMLEDFRKYSIPHLTRDPRDDLEWLILGQHYGLPTRLLDWTTNPLKALFFALYKCKNDGALFGLEPRILVSTFGESMTLESISDVTAFLPNWIDNRIIAQESCFTIFPLPPDSSAFTPLENMEGNDGNFWRLMKLVIPKEIKSHMLRELNQLGVSFRTLFPDLTGLSDYISWKLRDNLCNWD